MSNVLLVMSSVHLQQANINKVTVISGTGGTVPRFCMRYLEARGFPYFFYHGMFVLGSEVTVPSVGKM